MDNRALNLRSLLARTLLSAIPLVASLMVLSPTAPSSATSLARPLLLSTSHALPALPPLKSVSLKTVSPKTVSPKTVKPVRAKLARPVVTKNPVSVAAASGSNVTLAASASGSPAPSVQWQVSFPGSKQFTSIPLATKRTYVISNIFSPMSGDRYRAVFSNRAGHAATFAATLKVTPALPVPPTVTSSPVSITVPATFEASFAAFATGTPPPFVQWQVSSASSSPFTNISGATNDIYTVLATNDLNGARYRAVFSNKAGSVYTAVATLSISAAPTTTTTIPDTTTTTTPSSVPPGVTDSTNWSGYSVQGDVFNSVQASWTVVPVHCTAADSYSSTWIGIDGATSPSVEQDGTASSCQSGQASYGAWYEMYGDTNAQCNCNAMVPLDPTLYPVLPGDAVSASVNYASTKWTLAIADPTQGWTFSIVIASPSPAPDRSSAEWIVERPSLCTNSSCSTTKLATMTPMGPVTFTGAQASTASLTGPISDFGYIPVEMMTGLSVTSAPGYLSADGSSFTVTQ